MIMKYRITLLNILAFLFLLGCLLYTLVNYSILSAGEGWGVVYMIGLGSIGLLALIVDLIIQIFFRSKGK